MTTKTKTRLYGAYNRITDAFLGSISVRKGQQRPADTKDIKFFYEGSV